MTAAFKFALWVLTALSFLALYPGTSGAQERLAKIDTESLRILFFAGAEQFTLTATPRGERLVDEGKLEAEIISLEQKPQVVIDILGHPSEQTYTSLLQNPYFTALHLMPQPDKTRLVLDLAAGTSSQHKTSFDSTLKTLFIDLSVSKTSSASQPVVPQKPVENYSRARLSSDSVAPATAKPEEHLDGQSSSSTALSNQNNSLLKLMERSSRLGSLNSRALNAAVWQQGSEYTISITTKSSQLNSASFKPEVIFLDSPRRLVIDIPGYPSDRTDELKFSSKPFIALRQGIHPDKTRYVMDLNENMQPDYSIGRDETLNTLFVSLRAEEEQKKEQVEVIAPVTPSDILAKGSTLPGGFIVDNSGVIRKAQPSAESNESSMESSAEQSPYGKLNGITFARSRNRSLSSLVIEVEGLKDFTLLEKSPGKYLLTIKETFLGSPGSESVIEIPSSVSGYRAVTPEQFGENVLLAIEVEKSVRLLPTRTKNQVWLEAANY